MRILSAALGTLIALTGIAHAATSNAPGDIAVTAGGYSLRADGYNTDMAGIEYRFRDQYNGLRPTVGAFINGDGGKYGYAGAYWDLPLNTAPFVISPGFAIGAYGKGDSKPLGSTLEFRSTMEVTYKFHDGQRLGAQISHISNAGLGDSNPGVEMLQAVYSHPF